MLDSSLESALFYARISKVESVLWELCMESARQSNRESWLDICACYATESYNHPQLDKSVTRITSFISFPLSAAITFNVLVNGDRRHCFVAQ